MSGTARTGHGIVQGSGPQFVSRRSWVVAVIGTDLVGTRPALPATAPFAAPAIAGSAPVLPGLGPPGNARTFHEPATGTNPSKSEERRPLTRSFCERIRERHEAVCRCSPWRNM